MNKKKQQLISLQGFTLLELSIVLIIASLVVGAVFSGKSLMDAMRLRNISVEMTNYQTAVSAFKLKYQSLPGDYDQAAFVWPGTLSGNGNGLLEYPDNFLFWEHLSKAQLVGEQYSFSAPLERGIDYPNSRFVPAILQVLTNAPWLPTDYDGAVVGIVMSSDTISLGYEPGPLKPREAYMVDGKMDDGFPNTGRVASICIAPSYIATPSCKRCFVSGGGSYDQSNNDAPYCNMLFWVAGESHGGMINVWDD